MDGTQRGIVAALGVGLMLGAIAWVSTVSLAPHHSTVVRILVPAGMFVLGSLLVVWAIRGSSRQEQAPPSARAVLDRAIREGNEILGHDRVWAVLALNWQNATAERLREHLGEPAAHGLLYPPGGDERPTTMARRVRAQVTYLEGLRARN